MISSPLELEQTIGRINQLIQEVHDFIGPDDPHAYDQPKYMIDIPRGYIRRAVQFRQKLNFISDSNIKKNISYSLQLSDFYCWILNRTSLSLTVKEMFIKYGIVLMASICETIVVHVCIGRIGRNYGFIEKTKRMVAQEMITQEIQTELEWLWDTRLGIHIFALDFQEYNVYNEDHYSRSITAAIKLIDHLNE